MGYSSKETKKKYLANPLNRIKLVYSSMYQRCYNKDKTAHNSYGRKGITICDEWLDNPQSFYDWAMANGFDYIPDKNGRNLLTIDRIDNSKGYSPDNCRWISPQEQCFNKDDNIFIEYNGEQRTLNCWCKLLNLPYPRMYYRIHFMNMTLAEAIAMKDFKFVDKKPASNYKYIYKQKNDYVVEIKKKYYGRKKTLEEAVELRNSILEDMGLLEDLKEFELKYGGKDE